MFAQADRLLSIATTLGDDAVLMTALAGQEALSQLFHFQLDLAAEQAIQFDKLLGQDATAALVLPNGQKRYFNGIISRISTGSRDQDFFHYRAELVPKAWLLTRNVQSRIFQHVNVPDILKKVFTGLDVKQELVGTFHPREFCVQYRESDFDFASRLMEEEGIYYFFKHSNGGHQMVLANTPQSHLELDPATVLFDEGGGGTRDEDRITSWEKTQELRSGKCTLWDHNFELPHKHLEAEKTILQTVQVGQVQHKFLCGNDNLEIYDFPGRYAHRFDGVDKGGGDQPAELQKIFEDNKRTAEIRMQQEALPGLVIDGSSNCRHFVAGHKFRLERSETEDGQYVLTAVYHTARQQVSMLGDGGEFFYENRFNCIPVALPYRPLRVTPLPRIYGSQTAVVAGPPGEEIFTDKFGRVKVQFHWDREGKNDPDSSCWIRVSQPWAGKGWGSISIPRIGQEVVVDFIEGDPDRPIITGRVYNAEHMPPYELPAEMTKSTAKSYSSKGGGGFNEIRMEDKKGSEQVFIHGERNLDLRVKKDQFEWIGEETHLKVGKDQFQEITGDTHLTVKGDQNEKVDGTVSLKAGQDVQTKIGMKYGVDSGMEIHLKAGMNFVLESGTTLTLKVGGNFINLNPGGVFISGTMVMINSGGAAGSGSGCSPQPPTAPKEADKAKPGEMSQLRPDPPKPAKPVTYSAAAAVLKQAAASGAPLCDT